MSQCAVVLKLERAAVVDGRVAAAELTLGVREDQCAGVVERASAKKSFASSSAEERCGFAVSPLEPMTLMISVADAERLLSGK